MVLFSIIIGNYCKLCPGYTNHLHSKYNGRLHFQFILSVHRVGGSPQLIGSWSLVPSPFLEEEYPSFWSLPWGGGGHASPADWSLVPGPFLWKGRGYSKSGWGFPHPGSRWGEPQTRTGVPTTSQPQATPAHHQAGQDFYWPWR